MTVTSDFNDLEIAAKPSQLAINYRGRFNNLYNVLKKLDSDITRDKDGTDFSNLPTDAKQSLRNAWLKVQGYIADLESDSEVMEMINLE